MGITEAILHEVSEQAREKAYKEAWQEAWKEAWQEASVKVKWERDYEFIKNATQEGLPVNLIGRLTGRSEEEIKEIIARIQAENS